MASNTLSLLLPIVQAGSPKAYLDAQDRALPLIALHYEELLADVKENPDPAVRFEALGMISLLEFEDAHDALLASAKGDEDSSVSEFAKALLYRVTVANNLWNSGKISVEKYQEYKANVRQMAAEALFKPAVQAGDVEP